MPYPCNVTAFILKLQSIWNAESAIHEIQNTPLEHAITPSLIKGS